MTCILDNDIKNNFSLQSHIECDSNNLIWFNSYIYFNEWTGWASNFRNIPIGYLYNINQIKSIVKKWKDIFFEYIKYNYSNSIDSFKKNVSKNYEISYGLYERKTDKINIIRSKYLYKIIKSQWFSDELYDKVKNDSEMLNRLSDLEIDYDLYILYSSVGKFRIDEAFSNVPSKDFRTPFSHNDLKHIKEKLPKTYKCLEDYDQLYSLNYKLSNELKLYADMYVKLEERSENIDTPEIFNEKVKNLFPNDYNIDSHSGYVHMHKLHNIIYWYMTKD